MKKILIIGKESYIGRNLKKHFLNKSQGFMVNVISSRNDSWKSINFKIYDCVIYLAAAKPEHEAGASEVLNYYLNSDLPFEIASVAKDAGVSRFIFPSTIDIYGKYPHLGSDEIIDKNSVEAPESIYALSKLSGEKRLLTLQDDDFKLMILRLPLLYGPLCPGAYDKLKELVLSQSVLPKINNRLSAINISTLCAFIQFIIERDYCGILHPQNSAYTSSTELMNAISKELLSPIKLSKWLGLKYKLFKSSCPKDIAEFMGSLVYAKDIDM